MAAPFSPLVLGSAGMLTSPALYDAVVAGAMPLPTAALRFAVAAVVMWLGLTLLEWLVQATGPEAAAKPDATQDMNPGQD